MIAAGRGGEAAVAARAGAAVRGDPVAVDARRAHKASALVAVLGRVLLPDAFDEKAHGPAPSAAANLHGFRAEGRCNGPSAKPNAKRRPGFPMTDLTILPETADDALAIERLNERTFGPGRLAKTAYRLRERIRPPARTVVHRPRSARCWSGRCGSPRAHRHDAGAAARAAHGRAAVPRARHRPGADRSRARRGEGATATAWCCWSATSPITASAASSRFRRGVCRCRDRSIRRGSWSANWSRARSRAFPARSGRIGRLRKSSLCGFYSVVALRNAFDGACGEE